jgi:hypothetical protein
MDVVMGNDIDEESSGNNTEEDAEYLRNPHEIAQDRDADTADSDRDNMDEDDNGDDRAEDESEDDSNSSAVGSSDLEGPLVTLVIQISVRQSSVVMVNYYNAGMTSAARLLRRQSPLSLPKETFDF